MTVGNITQSTLYGITSASQMVKTTSSASSGYEELKSVEELIAQDDTDADGQLSIDETPLTEDMFTTADGDGDGYLTLEELEAYLASAPEDVSATGGPPPGGMPPEEEEDEQASSSAANAFAIRTYESVNANFMDIMAGDTESHTSSFLSRLVA